MFDVRNHRLKGMLTVLITVEMIFFLKIQQLIQRLTWTKQMSNIWILTSLNSKRLGHTFPTLRCYSLCVISDIKNRPHPMESCLSISIWKKSCISLWSGRLYPTAVNQSQVDELPPSYICLPANLSFTLSFFSSLSISFLFFSLIQHPPFFFLIHVQRIMKI